MIANKAKKVNLLLPNMLLFSDIVTLILFRENVTYEYKRGTISYDQKRDDKA